MIRGRPPRPERPPSSPVLDSEPVVEPVLDSEPVVEPELDAEPVVEPDDVLVSSFPVVVVVVPVSVSSREPLVEPVDPMDSVRNIRRNIRT